MIKEDISIIQFLNVLGIDSNGIPDNEPYNQPYILRIVKHDCNLKRYMYNYGIKVFNEYGRKRFNKMMIENNIKAHINKSSYINFETEEDEIIFKLRYV